MASLAKARRIVEELPKLVQSSSEDQRSTCRAENTLALQAVFVMFGFKLRLCAHANVCAQSSCG